MTTDREKEFERRLRLRWICGDADGERRPGAERFLRHDWERFVRPDWQRFVRPEFLERWRAEVRVEM